METNIFKIPRIMGMTPKERFEKYIYYSIDGCWYWLGALTIQGYGQFRIDGRTLRTHRISYTLYKGPITNGLLVCHHCDNKQCVNPNHLFLGTHQDNLDDMVSKGKFPDRRGVKASKAILTEDQVIHIRSLSGKVTQHKLARDFNVSRSAICHILLGNNWSHL